MKSGWFVRKIFLGSGAAYEVYRLTNAQAPDEQYNREIHGTYSTHEDAITASKMLNAEAAARFWKGGSE